LIFVQKRKATDMIINISTFDLLLRKHGMTQAALARRSRLGTKTIGRVRRGEELRISNAEKIASVFNVSIEELQFPPSDELREQAGKKSGLSRLVADLGSEVRNALTLTSLRYKLPEQDILEASPYFFTLLAELSLKRRREKLEVWKDAALAAIEAGPRRDFPMIESITADIWEVYYEELESIEQRDLSGGFTGLHSQSPTNENPGNPFFSMLEGLAGECGHDLNYEGLYSESFVPFYSEAHSDTVDKFLDPEGEHAYFEPDEDACWLLLRGDIPLADMPKELLESGSGPDRRAWVSNHPDYRPYFGGLDNIDDDIATDDLQLENSAGNGGSNA
jgi:transcriptional regulator with XRE-family HTH domain